MNSGFPSLAASFLSAAAIARSIGVKMPPDNANSVPAPPYAMHLRALRRDARKLSSDMVDSPVVGSGERTSEPAVLFQHQLGCASDFLQPVLAYSSQQVAIAGQRRAQRLGMVRRFVHLLSCQVPITVVQQPRCCLGPKSHPVEHVLVARRREDFLSMRKIFMVRRMEAPEFEAFSQALR